jgi:hypothetical protein
MTLKSSPTTVRNDLSVLNRFSGTGPAVLIEVGFITNDSDVKLMTNLLRYMAKIIYCCLMGLFLMNCSASSSNERDNYRIKDYKIAKDCNFYVSVFEQGAYVFRFALSGSCRELNNTEFIERYRKSLIEHKSKSRKGLLVIDYYKEMQLSSNEIQKLYDLTKSLLKHFSVKIINVKNERITIKLY